MRQGAPLTAVPESPAHAGLAPVAPQATGRPRLEFLEGLRALTALYVVCGHATTVLPNTHLSVPLRWVLTLFSYPHFAVSIFIVVSGYCLMLPVAASESHSWKGGTKSFIRRRARRILPPYYAALFFSLPVDLFYKWTKAKPVSWKSLIAHLFLVHNLRFAWSQDINGVLWTVATEWQIYFIFALVLLPMFRRAGIMGSLFIAVLLAYPLYLTSYGRGLFQAAYWYIALFAFGMVAAYGTHGAGRPPDRLRARSSRAAAACIAAIFMVSLPFYRWTWMQMMLLDTVAGLATASFIYYCATPVGLKSRAVRVLSSNPLFSLGVFSYSIYLVHFPLLSIQDWFLKKAAINDNAQFVLQLGIAVPASVAAAYIFFVLFERPFLSLDRRHRVRVTPSTVAAP